MLTTPFGRSEVEHWRDWLNQVTHVTLAHSLTHSPPRQCLRPPRWPQSCEPEEPPRRVPRYHRSGGPLTCASARGQSRWSVRERERARQDTHRVATCPGVPQAPWQSTSTRALCCALSSHSHSTAPQWSSHCPAPSALSTMLRSSHRRCLVQGTGAPGPLPAQQPRPPQGATPVRGSRGCATCCSRR